MRSTTYRFAVAAVMSTGAVALVSRSGEAASAPTRGALIMTSFVQQGRTDVRRNESLTFKFTVQLQKKSVDDRSLRVLAITDTGTKPAVGARIVRGNIVTFDPTRSQRNYDASKQPDAKSLDKDHVFGFESYEDYNVEIPTDSHRLLGTRGQGIRNSYTSTFRTNGVYDDLVPGAPFFIGDHGTGVLGFEPPRSGTTGLVDADAQIVIEFNEPMDINSLDPGNTVVVTRVAINEQVPGFIKTDPNSPSGRRFLFVPSVGFGSDNANIQGWDIGVTLTTGVTDLAGNRLKRPLVFPVFRTRYVANAPSCSVITESFNNTTLMDPQTLALGGDWNGSEKGALRGGAATLYPTIYLQYTAASTGIGGLVRTRFQEPLVGATLPTASVGCTSHPNGARLQQLYVPADVGVAAAIVSIGWGPSSNALFGALYPQIEIDIGHTQQTSLSSTYDSNIDIGSPIQAYKGPYTVPQVKNIQPTDVPLNASGVSPDLVAGVIVAKGDYDYPTLTAPFEWNGVNNLVIDWKVQGGDECQIFRAAFIAGGIPFPLRRAFGANYQGGTSDYAPDGVVYDTSFKKRRRLTYAISLWYQVASDIPTFASPIVSPVGQPGGVSLKVELEGANGKPDPFNAGGFIADPTTGTGFSTNYHLIDKHRFFRFRITMGANLITNQSARVASFALPYCF